MRPKRRFFPRQRRNLHRINNDITHTEVRLVGKDIEPGVYSRDKALALADEKGLDLVEISPKAIPPVCRIIDYKKFLYEKKKKEKELKSRTAKAVLKEIRFTPNTDDHDFEFKMKHAMRFLLDGAKVKAYVQFKGRNMLFQDRGELLLLRLAQELDEVSTIDEMPKLQGRRMFLFLSPKIGKKTK